MPVAPVAYVMKGVINQAPYQDVTWKVFGTPDMTGAQSGYTNLINIVVDYIITDELAGFSAVQIEETVSMAGDCTGLSNNNQVVMTGDVTGRTSANTVTKLQNRNVSSAAPTNGNSLVWVASGNDWEPKFPDQQNIAIFNSSGSWTAPVGVTQVRAWGYGGGGGGGGGGAGQTGGANGGNGGPGGGGSWASLVSITVVPGTTYTITVGAGGSGGGGGTSFGFYGNTGLTGGTTSFDTLYSWFGGQGGGQGIGVVQGPPTFSGGTMPLLGDTSALFGITIAGMGGNGGYNSSFDGNAGQRHIGGASTGGSGGVHGTNPDTSHRNGGGGGGGASNSSIGSAPNGGDGDPQPGPGHVPQGGGNGGSAPSNSGHGGGGGGGGGGSASDPGGHGGTGGNGGSGKLIVFW